MTEAFREEMAAGYGFDGPRIHIGRRLAAAGAEPAGTAVDVALPLGFLNRHGLIAGRPGRGRRARSSSSPSRPRPPAARSSRPT